MLNNNNENSLSANLAFELLNSDARRQQVVSLLDEYLPSLAADVENFMYEQEAKVNYQLVIEDHQPQIRVGLKLKKFEHEFTVLLNSASAMFIIGHELGGQRADTAHQAAQILKPMLLRFKA